MLIERIYLDNPPLSNFNHIVACEKTGEALAIDPFDADIVLNKAEQKGWTIKQIISTHEHGDHTRGNVALMEKTGAKLLAHKNAAGKIRNVDTFVDQGDIIHVGQTVKLTVLTTLGHTMAHLCLYAKDPEPVLFCGDTLFNAGVGNCHNGGDAGALYHTVIDHLFGLPDETKIYPGHDYIENNLTFALSREPHNQDAKVLLEQVSAQTPDTRIVTDLKLEKKVNPFLRVHSQALINQLKQDVGGLVDRPKEIFLALRELRNHW
ncbi:Hydroxyacylglutathione hydrolase [Piscirickettsia salmonis]|uniref:hydroxyacylglutathione hydrolase n=1 Tax=Piscirickettsia salmonis TaxID=1238 RepID=UPI0012B6B63B|nr:hydroxyacylglutathione hydrolase [Piscirickettsia salmonis]QGP48686.1 Hydroxyacylglutathione hydrolase [Piscirickettsia salmonis]QGP52717.1 Hydroxyacylglutathione hydrolase [Piscirickettsia salmonis]QGP57580.1 Hydroxyacylglutathione hydrolase [Piscirickettsia salmonis]QGP62285.1 Hydroxyacylglutathione hydrolase [Piscirickettsia salmonis]